MRISINKERLKKVALIGINYQLIVNILPSLIHVVSLGILEEPLLMDIKKHTLGYMLWAITLAPIWEELLYRKFLYGKLSKKLSKKTAMIISSLLFALFHFNLILGLFAYGIGIISCKIYDKTNDIKYSILFHSICNFFGVIFHNYINFNIYSNKFDLITIQVILIIVLIASIGAYIRYTSKMLKKL